MGRFNRRDLFAGLVIVFLVGVLAGKQWSDTRRSSTAAAVREGQNVAPPTAKGDASELRRSSDTFARIAESATPAVVNINSTRITRGRKLRDPYMQWFFGDQQQQDRTSQSLGSGVIVDPDGIVVTNNHNIAASGADQVEVQVSLANGRDFPAKVIGADPDSDIAVLKIDAKNLPFVAWGQSTQLRVGDWVVAIGNPYGLSQTVTAGIVSAKGRRDLGVSQFEEFIQTDAAINPGNSGGALLDVDGRLVGINTAIFTESGGYQGLGFAIPAEVAQANAEQILRTGKVVRGWIGVVSRQLTRNIATQLGLATTEGALLIQFYQNQPAAGAGLQRGDVVTAVEGKPVKTPGDLRTLIAATKPGTEIKLSIVRGGQTTSLKLRTVQRPVSPDGEPLPGT
ncbi:MAG: trypsin-like peptidase domain-containing protein [Armatimonadetes bacterium]|nr:trypsin-like peptidase domain-containing protein [Armatimonadota bacterium]